MPCQQAMPKVLITGGAGFIGGHTATTALNMGWEVAILDNLSTGMQATADALEAKGVRWTNHVVRGR